MEESAVLCAQASDYRIAHRIFWEWLVLRMLQCDNPHCNSKANGSRSGAAIIPPMSLASSSELASQESLQGAPKVFRQRNSQRLIMEI
ncbi:MAG TPA: hypothetical protein PKM82_02375, partial [Acidovorax sp.]|nr:hypothetical protein [Acidovorax sp.]